MDIKIFTYGVGVPRGWAGGVISSEKQESHKNSARSKIKFYIIFITFSLTDIKIFTNVGGQGHWPGLMDFF